MTKHVVVVGGGQAAASASLRLRSAGYTGKIDIVSDEDSLPYQRPPLSKKFLKGEMEQDRLLLRPDAIYKELAIDIHRGVQALHIDRVGKTVGTDQKSSLVYDKLVLATGAAPRCLPVEITGEFQNVFTFRNIADANILRSRMTAGQRLLVIGGGYIGLEMAAVAIGLGLEVSLVEVQDRILNRVASVETAEYFRQLHMDRGVDLREGVGLSRLVGQNGRAEFAVLSDGSGLGVDLVVVGIGVLPNDALARAAGLAVNGGIQVDENCRTFDPDIYAIGDCAVFPYCGEPTRLESVQNACDQGEYVAGHILGLALGPYVPEPWFWSDQYDVSMKIAGFNRGYDRVIRRVGERPGSISLWYFRGETFLAVDAINDPKAYMIGKRWLSASLSPDITILADATVALKDIPTETAQRSNTVAPDTISQKAVLSS